jgi:hypothetical protein
LPVAIDPAPWQQAARPLFTGERPVVVHVPSNAQLKGTDRIDAVLHELRCLGDLVGVGHIGWYDERRTAGLRDLGGNLLQTVAAAGQQGDRGTVGGESSGDGGADPAGGAGDECDA